MIVAFSALLTVPGVAQAAPTPQATNTTKPAKVCSVAPATGQAAITKAIAGCPDGSVVRFPRAKTYRQDGPIRIDDRHGLTIDGNGSTFVTTSTSTAPGMGNFTVLRGTGITFQNIVARGTFDLKPPYSVGRYPSGIGWESNTAFAFFGTNGGGVRDSQVYNVWGDGVILAFDGILDAAVRCYGGVCDWQVARNMVIERVSVDNASRTCFAPTQTRNNVIRDSHCRNAWMWGIDAEADGYPVEQDGQLLHNALPIDGLLIERVTFGGYGFGAIAVPVGGDFDTIVGNITIRNNTIGPRQPSNPCGSTVLVGAYPAGRLTNVVIEGNDITAMANAVEMRQTDGGAIRNNTFRYTDYGLVGGAEVQCEPGRRGMIVQSGNIGVAVEGNLEIR